MNPCTYLCLHVHECIHRRSDGAWSEPCTCRCLCPCLCTCTHIRTHVTTHVEVGVCHHRMSVYPPVAASLYAHMCADVFAHVYTCMHVYAPVHILACGHVYTHAYARVYTHVQVLLSSATVASLQCEMRRSPRLAALMQHVERVTVHRNAGAAAHNSRYSS